MAFSRVTTDMRTAGKAAWVVFVLCTVIMGVMSVFSRWPVWTLIVLLVHAAVITVLTFHPKASPILQSNLMMLFSFGNIFMCTLAEGSIYPSLQVFLGAAVLLMVYRDERLLFSYELLVVWAVLFHMCALETIPFDTPREIAEFFVRISVHFTVLFFLLILMSGINASRALMKKSVEDAQRAEHYKSDFLANMSHEIRTPMNAIVGMCELILRENTLTNSVRENAFNIQTSSRSLLSIINDILDFSKIESGKMEFVEEEFNIASLLNDVVNMSEARRSNKKIDILVDADPLIPRGLIGDEVRIRQVIINLMTNAVKFTQEGRVTLTVSRSKQDYGINLFVSVKDTGIGITQENIEKLFTSFRQVDTKKNRSVEGTGLGLAISKRLVEGMGGFISVTSEYGIGSNFSFVVPLRVSDDRPFISLRSPASIHAAACYGATSSVVEKSRLFRAIGHRLGTDFRYANFTDDLKALDAASPLTHIFVSAEEYAENMDFYLSAARRAQVIVIRDREDLSELPEGIRSTYNPFYVISAISALNNESLAINLNEHNGADIRFSAPDARILIVDDNVINLKVAMGLMQPYNMQISLAQSGPEAIKRLESKDIDLVFMDHMMPDMDGVDATQLLRTKEDPYYKDLPIIALTANATNDARALFMRSGFSDFLAKPIELTALDRILRNWLPREYIHTPIMISYEEPAEGSLEHAAVTPPPSLLDVKKGISYMGGDEKDYWEILSFYVQKSTEKIAQIGELFDHHDLKNYVIEVHALKSASMTMGAVELAELARELEAAGKAGRVDSEKNSQLLSLYAQVAEAAQQYLSAIDELTAEREEPSAKELTEMSTDALRDYIDEAIAACRSFDGDTAARIARETAGFSFGGEPMADYFGKAAGLAEDFEYEAAEQVLTELERSVLSA